MPTRGLEAFKTQGNPMYELSVIRRAVLLLAVGASGLLGACGGGADDAQGAAPAEQEAAAGFDTAGLQPAASVAQLTADVLREQALAASVAEGGAVKWNPGHYVHIDKSGPEDALREVAGTPVKGLLMRYGWNLLEPSQGVYDFSRIERHLALMKAKGKRLFVLLNTKNFNGPVIGPSYLKGAEYEGGTYQIEIDAKATTGTEQKFGANIKLYNDNVKARLIALVQALGARFNNEDNFEGIGFVETALGDAVTPLTEEQIDKFFVNLAEVNTAAKAAFPNTVVLQYANFPIQALPVLTEEMRKSGVGMSGPDIFPEHPGLNRLPSAYSTGGAYSYHPRLSGTVPLAINASGESYLTTTLRGPLKPQSSQALHAFARDRLLVNYMFWVESNKAPAMGYDSALSYMKSVEFPTDAAGGLASACPSMFPACVSSLAAGR
jgi:hypothetical protein